MFSARGSIGLQICGSGCERDETEHMNSGKREKTLILGWKYNLRGAAGNGGRKYHPVQIRLSSELPDFCFTELIFF